MRAGFVAFIFIAFLSTTHGQNYARFGISKSEEIPEGLKAGDIAPQFRSVNQYGDSLSLYRTLQFKPVVLIFYRGFWCPSCNGYLSDYQDSLQLIRDAGATIIAVTPEASDGIEKSTKQTGVTFEIISDHDLSIMKNYNVDYKVTDTYQTLTSVFAGANISKNNEQDEAYLPVPATYLIGKEGKIRYVWFNPDYRKRAYVKDVLIILKELQE